MNLMDSKQKNNNIMNRTKRLLFSMLTLLCCCTGAWADEVDDATHLKYTVTDDEVTITGFADDFTPGANYALVIPDVIDGKPVVAVGASAFFEKTNFTTLTIGKNVKTIGNEAFRKASTMTSVTFAPDGVLETLGESAFRGCAELIEFEMPNTVKSVGNMVLQANAKLASVTLSNQLTTLSTQALCNCPMLKTVVIPASVTTIASKAFWHETGGLEEITIPSTVTSVASDAFNGCCNLKTVTWNSATVPGNIFKDKTSLQTVTFGESVTTIENYAFQGCTGLTELTIPATLTKIETFAFTGCTNVTTVTTQDGTLAKTGDYYELSTLAHWRLFSVLVLANNTANAKMTDDIDLGDDQTMIGSGSNPYKGTFDGDGHKLTVHYVNPSEGFIGPFTKVQNSIIKNLHVAGSITTENRFTGAIVGTVANGSTCTLQNCRSSVACQFTHVGDSYVQSGGIFGTVNENATLTMTDCLFDGSLSTMVSSKGMGGMVGWNYKGTVNMDNCLFAPQSVDVNTENIYTLIGSSSVSINHITNCYYATSIGTVQGTQATAEQLADGTITYKLQNNREDLVWGQRIGTDAEPVLTNDESYRVYRSINGGYTNDPTLVYEGLQKDVNDNYLLGCVWDWKEFAEIVNSGTNNTANAKMTADIDLGDDQTMIGSESNPYKGTFDGCGHSIHVSITGNEEIGSPFRCISSATIKNVKVTGSVLGGIHCSGLVGVALSGTCTISNCEVAVSVTCNSTHCGGIIGHGRSSNTTIENCLFSGSISGPTTATGIFYGWGDGGTHNNVNCLSAGNYTGSSGVNLACGYGITITNCYRKTSGGSQGTDASSMTATELATALNNGGQEVWVQDPITNQPMLAIFANAVTLSDGDDLSALSAYAGKTCKVDYSRSFTEAKSSTVCLPFAFAKGSVGTFYTFTGITHEGSNYEATMTEYTGATLEANTPYLFTPSATGSVDFGGTYTLPASITVGSTTSGDWTYLGTYETISWTEAPTGIYGFSAQAVEEQGISQGQFVKVGAYVRIKPMRCYLEYTGSDSQWAGARGMTRAADEELPETIKVRLISADGEVTAIGSLSTVTGEVTFDKDAWYSLDGRRFEGKPSAKGIYVNNGKKIVVK